MKFIQIEINLPGAEKPYVLGGVFDDSEWRPYPGSADLLDGWMSHRLEQNAGALDLLCSDGVHRRIGSALLAQAIVQYRIVEMPAPEMAAEEMRDAA